MSFKLLVIAVLAVALVQSARIHARHQDADNYKEVQKEPETETNTINNPMLKPLMALFKPMIRAKMKTLSDQEFEIVWAFMENNAHKKNKSELFSLFYAAHPDIYKKLVALKKSNALT